MPQNSEFPDISDCDDDDDRIRNEHQIPRCFPSDLAEAILDRWDTSVVGPEYDRPPLPEPSDLRQLLETCYLASLEFEEGRPSTFALACTPFSDHLLRQNSRDRVDAIKFSEARPLTVPELRRIAPTVDMDLSSVWALYAPASEQRFYIHGLLHTGSSWSRARDSKEYTFASPPSAVNIYVHGPGRIDVFQGQYFIAGISSGRIQDGQGPSFVSYLGISDFLQEGLDGLAPRLLFPEISHAVHEPMQDRASFEWAAYLNVFNLIANEIRHRNHGGTLIVCRNRWDITECDPPLLRFKYKMKQRPRILADRFSDFRRSRNEYVERCYELELRGFAEEDLDAAVKLGRMRETMTGLVDAAKFVANLASIDGAVVVTQSFAIVGFGAEITAERDRRKGVFRIIDPLRRTRVPLNPEEFGMRHRSAIRLCANSNDVVVFIFSQDGDISLCWSDGNDVLQLKGFSIANASMAGC